MEQYISKSRSPLSWGRSVASAYPYSKICLGYWGTWHDIELRFGHICLPKKKELRFGRDVVVHDMILN